MYVAETLSHAFIECDVQGDPETENIIHSL